MARPKNNTSNEVEKEEVVSIVKEKETPTNIRFVQVVKTGQILRDVDFANPKTFDAYLKNKKNFKQLQSANGVPVLEVSDKQDYIDIQTQLLQNKEAELEAKERELNEKLAALNGN